MKHTLLSKQNQVYACLSWKRAILATRNVGCCIKHSKTMIEPEVNCSPATVLNVESGNREQ